MRAFAAWFLAVVLFGSLAACDKKDLPSVPSVDSIKQAVTNQVESVRQTADAAGSVQLELNAPVTASGCYGRWIAANGGRPAVLTIASYNSPSNEAFPSFFVQAQTKATSAAQLVGEPIDAVAFVQEAKDGPVWHSPDGKNVKLAIAAAADGMLSGQVTGVLVNTDTGAEKQIRHHVHRLARRRRFVRPALWFRDLTSAGWCRHAEKIVLPHRSSWHSCSVCTVR